MTTDEIVFLVSDDQIPFDSPNAWVAASDLERGDRFVVLLIRHSFFLIETPFIPHQTYLPLIEWYSCTRDHAFEMLEFLKAPNGVFMIGNLNLGWHKRPSKVASSWLSADQFVLLTWVMVKSPSKFQPNPSTDGRENVCPT